LKIIRIIILLFIFAATLSGQQTTNFRREILNSYADTISTNGYSIIPGSIKVRNKSDLNSLYIDYSKGVIYIKKAAHITLPLNINFRIFKMKIKGSKSYFNSNLLQKNDNKPLNILDQTKGIKENKTNFTDKLNRSGSISRGFSIGSNQDMVFDSKLNLQINGPISDNINIQGVITDNNIPFQPDGYTQQLQDFDRVFVRLYSNSFDITAGDINTKSDNSYFLRLNRKGQGAKVKINTSISGKDTLVTSQAITVNKGVYHKLLLKSIEGNQGPYKITGKNNELNIIIISGSERVYVDGKLLKRGYNFDYIIDYNLGEISFTAKNPVTENSRITVEFEYTDRSYSRYQILSKNSFSKKNHAFSINYYREKDNPNKPLSIDLNDDNVSYLSSIGDNSDLALISMVDSVKYSNDRILYAKIDTIISGKKITFYRQSNNPDKAFFDVRFRYVGRGNGDYVIDRVLATGKSFKYSIRNNGKKSGDYESSTHINTPSDNHLINFRWRGKISKTTVSESEIAYSYSDKNLYSNLDDGNNSGIAIRQNIITRLFTKDSTEIKNNFTYIYRNSNFSTPEDFRGIEYNREWNIIDNKTTTDNFVNNNISIIGNKHTADIGYGFMANGSDAKRHKPSISYQFTHRNLKASANASYLFTTDSINKSTFINQNSEATINIKKSVIGVKQLYEYITWTNKESGLLADNSKSSIAGELFFKSKIDKRNKTKLSYLVRNDNRLFDNQLKPYTFAHQLNAEYENTSKKGNHFSAILNYRNVSAKKEASDNIPENTLNARINYRFKVKNGFIIGGTGYSFGSGLENKKEFIYLKVAPGKGVYSWTDYNNNNIKELDEFEVAQFSDQAEYIRIFKTSTNYESVYKNGFNLNLRINFNRLYKTKKRKLLSIKNLTNNFSYKSERKSSSTDILKNMNIFYNNSYKSSIVFLNQNISNVVTYKLTRKLILKHIYKNGHNINLMVNGTDTRKINNNTFVIKWIPSRVVSIENQFKIGEKTNNSDYLKTKNYSIKEHTNLLKLTLRPTDIFMVELLHNNGKKNNIISNKESARKYDWEISSTYNTRDRKSLATIKLKYIVLKYTGTDQSPIAYEMLEALKSGNNTILEIRFNRQLTKLLNLSVVYHGRNLPETKMIHTGSLELKAVF